MTVMDERVTSVPVDFEQRKCMGCDMPYRVILGTPAWVVLCKGCVSGGCGGE